MENLFNIYKENKVIAKYNSWTVTKKKEYVLLKFKKINIISFLELRINDEFTIDFYSYGISGYSFEKREIDAGTYDDLIIKVSVSDSFKSTYIVFQIILISSWFNNDKAYEWRKLSLLRKKIWVNSCLQWSGIKSSFIPNENYVFDGINVNSEIDLYCYLGELFIGDKGYLGKGIDGLFDCLNDFILEKSKIYTIHFENFEHLKKVLNTPENFNENKKNYTNILIEIFENRGFTITFDLST